MSSKQIILSEFSKLSSAKYASTNFYFTFKKNKKINHNFNKNLVIYLSCK